MVMELNDRLRIPDSHFCTCAKIGAGLKKELKVPALSAFLDEPPAIGAVLVNNPGKRPTAITAWPKRSRVRATKGS